ncbi:MAG: hypothetical protein AAFY71_28730 [Bacteroidota bacterium]
MHQKNDLGRLFFSIAGIPLTEALAHLPNVDEITIWLKLLIQIILLLIAILQLAKLFTERKKAREKGD